MPRQQHCFPVAICSYALLVLAAVGCGAGASVAPVTTKAPVSESGAAALRPQRRLLSLPAGQSSAHVQFTAPSPAKYVFDVALDLPASAHIVVEFHTWYGAVLDILDYKPGEQRESSTINNQSTRCKVAASRLVCIQHYPFLPAQKAGPWTLVVVKRSAPPATVRVGVTFHKP
jgi:hypothetical protein